MWFHRYLLSSVCRDAASDAGAAAAAAAAATPWYQGVADVSPEIIGTFQNMGLDKKTPAEAAVVMAKSFRETQQKLGIPASEIVRWPKDASDEQGWQAIRTRMGVPTDKAQYDEGLKAVKRADGQPIDETMVAFGRELAAKLKLPASDAPALVQSIMEDRDRRAAGELAEKTAKIAESRAALKKDWGANETANLTIAKQTAAKLGMKAETVAALENMTSYAEVMNMFLKLGQATGEDKLVLGGVNGVNNGVMTQEQAKAEIAALQQDAAFRDKLMKGDQEAKRKWSNLTMLASGYAA